MSSAKPTDDADIDGAPEQTGGEPGESGQQPVQITMIVAIAVGSALIGGWVMLLAMNRWHFTAPVLFLLMGWASILLVAYFLWRAAWSAAAETADMSDEEFFRPSGERDELEAEKRSLIKAIKEIEFDHQMGKMSDEDADQLTRYYRARAIDVIKELERAGSPAEADLPVAELISRDVELRLKLTGKKKPKKDKSATPAGEEASP